MNTNLLLMKRYFLFCLLALPSAFSFAQTCETTAFQQLSPQAKQLEETNNQLLYNYLLEQSSAVQKTIYTIPIVFHVVHQNGPENISDAEIIAAVEECNQQLSNSGVFQTPDGSDANLRVCLASVDPFGNPTDGITRHESPLTVAMYGDMNIDMQLKNLGRWCPPTYLNVWIVSSVSSGFASGYATFPGSYHDGHQGIVMEHDALTYGWLAHEVGHYFFLYHTFDGVPCLNDNCLQDGDKVCDTPVDITAYGCQLDLCDTDMNDTTGLNPFTSNVVEMPNCMDYSDCRMAFSQGQGERMHGALMQFRSTFLQSNGCGGNPGMPEPVASFTVDSSGCTGKLHLVSTSTNSLYTEWDFESDGFTDTIGADIYHYFPATGYYTIQMLVSGYGGSDTISQTVYVRVAPTLEYPIDGYTNIHYDAILQTEMTCPGVESTFSGVPGMVSYEWSNGETTEDIAFTVDGDFSISLTAIDADGNSWTSCRVFEPLISPQLSIGMDPLTDTVYCIEHVMLSLDPIPWYNTISNTWFHNGNSVTQNQILYPFLAATPGVNSYYVTNTDVNGCTVQSDTLVITIVDPPAPTLSQAGNVLTLSRACSNMEWFLDGNVIIGDDFNDSSEIITELGCYHVVCYDCSVKNSDTLCVTSLNVGLTELNEGTVTVAPNPFQQITTLSFAQKQQRTTVKVVDLQGQVLETQIVSDTNSVELDLSDYAKGLYFIDIRDALDQTLSIKVLSH